MASGLCENCHQRPKFGTHRFCGKTCAAQAAARPAKSSSAPSQPQTTSGQRHAGRQKGTAVAPKAIQLCTYCGQKPKFSNFDYCGKSCAALAAAAQTKPPAAPGASGAPRPKTTTRVPNPPLHTTQAPAPTKPHKAPRSKVPVPQDDSTEEDDDGDDDDGGVSTDLDAYPSDSESELDDEPNVPAVAHPPSAKAARGSKPAPKMAPGTCGIPGCGQPSHVDRNGVKTAYCSLKHREEAVKLGLEAACIMCQRYPQSTSDYFCSSACRNQSMTKT